MLLSLSYKKDIKELPSVFPPALCRYIYFVWLGVVIDEQYLEDEAILSFATILKHSLKPNFA